MVVPLDVRDIIGLRIFKVPTGQTDEFRAASLSAGIISDLKQRIRIARDAGKQLEQLSAEHLADRYRKESEIDPDKADLTKLTDVIAFALKSHGLSWADHARVVREADYDLHGALLRLPGGDMAAQTADQITGHATPFLAFVERWKPHAGLKPRPLDQAISSINQFEKAVAKPIEQIAARDVQRWIDGLLNPGGDGGLAAKTVNRKLSEIRNYWRWMQSHEVIAEDHNPFTGRRVRDPADRRKTKDDIRQRLRPDEVVRFWETAEQHGDHALAAAIRIAAYSGARIEGVSRLKVSDIRVDPDTNVQFMRMVDKTVAGDRCIPVHPKISRLLKELSGKADSNGYLIPSDAKNKYGERSQPIGKRFGRLKTSMGFDSRYVFHSIRHTISHMFETMECPEGVSKDILGHMKTDLTYGLYSGETKLDHRARWLNKAITYPETEDISNPILDRTETDPSAHSRFE